MLLKPLLQSAEAGIADASSQLDRSAAQVTRLAGAFSAAESAATVNISAEARGAGPTQDSETHGSLEGAIVDTRIAKYAFIANLRTLQTGSEMAEELNKLGQKR
jgi:hypothetical protein